MKYQYMQITQHLNSCMLLFLIVMKISSEIEGMIRIFMTKYCSDTKNRIALCHNCAQYRYIYKYQIKRFILKSSQRNITMQNTQVLNTPSIYY